MVVGRSSKNLLPMIRIAVTEAAFNAITATLPLGSVGYSAEVTANGEHLIWIELAVVDCLRVMRRPGESYRDVISRLAEAGAPRNPAEAYNPTWGSTFATIGASLAVGKPTPILAACLPIKTNTTCHKVSIEVMDPGG